MIANLLISMMHNKKKKYRDEIRRAIDIEITKSLVIFKRIKKDLLLTILHYSKEIHDGKY